MRTLCMDSAHKHLVIALYQDETLVASCEKEAWKQQSECIFPELIKLMESVGWTSDDLDQVVITKGPGSYTGVRIAMSIAKVLCTTKQLPLYTISTFHMYAGLCEDALVLLDARSSRVYYGRLHKGVLLEETIHTIEDVKKEVASSHMTLYGDTDLIGEEAAEEEFAKNFMLVKDFWERVENIHTLIPTYLKEQDAYKGN